MAFDGDISQMGHLADRIADLASVPSRAARAASQGIARLIEEEFASGHDPYGEPWAPLAPATVAKGRKPPPLTETYDLRKSVDVAPMQGAGIAITIGEPYAPPHQTGWDGPLSSGPARPILPAGSELPPDWSDVIEAAVRKEVRP